MFFEDFVDVLQMILWEKKSMLVLGLYSKNKKSLKDKANIGNPKVNRGCPPLTANRTSADYGENSLGSSIQYIPLGVYHTGGFNVMSPRDWPFVRDMHRSQVDSLHKGQWRGTLLFSLICAWRRWWLETPSRSLWRHCNLIKTWCEPRELFCSLKVPIKICLYNLCSLSHDSSRRSCNQVRFACCVILSSLWNILMDLVIMLQHVMRWNQSMNRECFSRSQIKDWLVFKDEIDVSYRIVYVFGLAISSTLNLKHFINLVQNKSVSEGYIGNDTRWIYEHSKY